MIPQPGITPIAQSLPKLFKLSNLKLTQPIYLALPISSHRISIKALGHSLLFPPVSWPTWLFPQTALNGTLCLLFLTICRYKLRS